MARSLLTVDVTQLIADSPRAGVQVTLQLADQTTLAAANVKFIDYNHVYEAVTDASGMATLGNTGDEQGILETEDFLAVEGFNTGLYSYTIRFPESTGVLSGTIAKSAGNSTLYDEILKDKPSQQPQIPFNGWISSRTEPDLRPGDGWWDLINDLLYIADLNGDPVAISGSGSGGATLTASQIVSRLEGLSGNDRLSSTAVQGLVEGITDLDDTPNAFGSAGQLLAVNSDRDAVEWIDAPSGGGTSNAIGSLVISPGEYERVGNAASRYYATYISPDAAASSLYTITIAGQQTTVTSATRAITRGANFFQFDISARTNDTIASNDAVGSFVTVDLWRGAASSGTLLSRARLEVVAQISTVQAFTDLSDTPGTLGTAGQIPAVNTARNALEFIDAPSGGGSGQDDTARRAARDAQTTADNAQTAAAAAQTTANAADTQSKENLEELDEEKAKIGELERTTSGLGILTHNQWINSPSANQAAFWIDSFNDDGSTSGTFATSHLADQGTGSSPFYNVRLRVPNGFALVKVRLIVGTTVVPTQWSEDTPDSTYDYYDELGGIELADGARVRVQISTSTSEHTYDGTFIGDAKDYIDNKAAEDPEGLVAKTSQLSSDGREYSGTLTGALPTGVLVTTVGQLDPAQINTVRGIVGGGTSGGGGTTGPATITRRLAHTGTSGSFTLQEGEELIQLEADNQYIFTTLSIIADGGSRPFEFDGTARAEKITIARSGRTLTLSRASEITTFRVHGITINVPAGGGGADPTLAARVTSNENRLQDMEQLAFVEWSTALANQCQWLDLSNRDYAANTTPAQLAALSGWKVSGTNTNANLVFRVSINLDNSDFRIRDTVRASGAHIVFDSPAFEDVGETGVWVYFRTRTSQTPLLATASTYVVEYHGQNVHTNFRGNVPSVPARGDSPTSRDYILGLLPYRVRRNTQTQYDNTIDKDANTLYLIVG